MKHSLKTVAIAAVFVGFALSAFADDGGENGLLEMSLQELMSLEVTGMSKKEDVFSEVPAAAYVITEADIKRNPATTIPELLKMVPGITVSQVNSGRYAVSSRGFNLLYSNKLLVLVDGREAYSSLFSSTDWDAVDMPLDNIKRIEVYRGPAGTIYGSNAVNGIISIITKHAEETTGTYSAVTVGNVERVIASARQGGRISDDYYARISAQYRNRDRFDTPGDENPGSDTGLESYNLGIRIDGNPSEQTRVESQLHFNTSRIRDSFLIPDRSIPGGHESPTDYDRVYEMAAQQTLEHTVSEELTLAALAYYSRSDRDSLDADSILNTTSLEGRAIWQASETVEIIAGGNYRYNQAHGGDGQTVNVTFNDSSQSLTIASAFSQIEYRPSEQWNVLAGLRVEYNEFTTFEYMPNLRIGYYPSRNHTLWTSVGRATRLPSIVDESATAFRATGDVEPDTGLPVVVDFLGALESEVESLIAYEAGYRGQLTEKVSIDVSAFFYDYRDLQAIQVAGEPGFGFVPGSTDFGFAPSPAIVVPSGFGYNAEAEFWGAEASLRYSPTERFFANVNYSFLDTDFSGLGDITTAFNEAGVDPTNTVSVHLHFSPNEKLDLDAFYYFVDNLSSFPEVDAYHQLDAKVGYQLSEQIRLSLAGRNLTDEDHREWGQDGVINLTSTDVPRSYFGMIEIALD